MTDVTQHRGFARSLGVAMTISRLISPGLRSALILSAGLALISVPFMLGLEAAPVATALAVGVLMVALALAGTEPAGRGTLPLSAQAVYDRGLALGLMAAGAIFALSGDLGATAVFATAGVATLVVTAMTRYSARPT